MDLSAEEKQRIYQEEKARLEAQERLNKEAQTKKAQQGCVGCLGIVVAFFIFVAVVGSQTSHPGSQPDVQTTSSGESASVPNPAASPEPPAPEPRLVLKPHWRVTREEGGYVKIRGRVVNKMGHDLSYAQISFNLYDKAGAQIGTAMTNTTNLEAGGTWKFEALGLVNSEEAGTVRLAELDGY